MESLDWFLVVVLIFAFSFIPVVVWMTIRIRKLRRSVYMEKEARPSMDITSSDRKIALQKQKITAKTRKEILELNTKDNGSSKINRLYQKAYIHEKNQEFQESINEHESILDINYYYLKAWQGLERIYRQLGQNERIEEISDNIRLITDIIEFETNAEQKLNLRRIELRNLPFFADDLVWTFEPQINILLGKNGYGKSHLLRLLISLLQKDDNIAKSYLINAKKDSFVEIHLERNGTDAVIHRTKTGFKESIGKAPVLAIPDMRFLDKSKTTLERLDFVEGDLREYAAYHFLYEEPFESVIGNFLYKLCLMYIERKSFKLPIIQLIESIIHELTDAEFEFYRIRQDRAKTEFAIEVLTEGNDKPLPIQKASQGSLSVLAIFGLIYYYLRSVFPDTPESRIREKPAIVIIDELCAHLHPSWHQKIIRLLRESFPNVQFIVTSHSPLVVAGCFENEVSVLRRNESGFEIEQLKRDFLGYEAKELYETIFEIEEKDENYLKYVAMYPFKEDIEAEIAGLVEKKEAKGLSKDEETHLQELRNEMNHLESAKQKYEERSQTSDLLIEISKLKAENRKLKEKFK